jgi:uncharacterized membrane protein
MDRSLLKTFSFAALHFGVAFSVTYALTGSLAVATGVGLIEPVLNTIVFYFHERAWQRGHRAARVRAATTSASCGIVEVR